MDVRARAVLYQARVVFYQVIDTVREECNRAIVAVSG